MGSNTHERREYSLFSVPGRLDDFCHTPVVFAPIFLVETRCLHVCRRVWVRVSQQRLDGGEDRCNVVDGTPLVLKNVEANAAIRVDYTQKCLVGTLIARIVEHTIWVKHFCYKLNLRCLVRVLLGEGKRELEGSAFPRSFVRSKMVYV